MSGLLVCFLRTNQKFPFYASSQAESHVSRRDVQISDSEGFLRLGRLRLPMNTEALG